MALIRYCMVGLILSGMVAEAQMGGMGGGGFGGPSVMGRAGAGTGRRGDLGSLTVFAGAQGVYDTGLTALSVNPQGDFRRQALAGVEVTFGATGAKSFRRSTVALHYVGDVIRYNVDRQSPIAANWNGSNQALSLETNTQLSKRTTAGLSVLAGTTNRAFGGLTGPLVFNQGLAGADIPFLSFFDNRMYYFNGMGQVTFQHGARWSTSLGGGGFAVRRRDGLISVDSGVARGDVMYRMSRNQTIGVDYQYMTFQFPRAFGDAHLHGLALAYNARLGRSWQVQLRAGAFRIETLGQRVVDVDPLVAEITGVRQAAEVSYSKNILPQGQASVTRMFRRGSLDFNAAIGPVPGNGLLLTSNQISGGMGYSHNLNRRSSVGLRANYVEIRGVGFVAGKMELYSGGGFFSYRFTKTLQLNAQVDRRVSQLNQARSIGVNGTRLSVGVMWSPSSLPISLW